MTLMMNDSLKALHDRLLLEKPDGAVHDSEACPLCAMQTPTAHEGEMTTYTEDELRAKVEAAVTAASAERDAKIAELTATQQTAEAEAAVKAAKDEADAKIAELQTALDAKAIEAANVTTEKDGIVAWLEGERVKAEEAAAVEAAAATAAARKDGRVAKAKEVAGFDDEYLTANADRFAAMSDEDFEAACESWSKISGRKPSTVPPTTLTAGLEGGLNRQNTSGNSYKELTALRRDRGHVDLANL